MSNWQQRFKVHPAADLFPMMEAEELDRLGADIKANGLRKKIAVCQLEILDGRNRLEAMERFGIDAATASSPRSNRLIPSPISSRPTSTVATSLRRSSAS